MDKKTDRSGKIKKAAVLVFAAFLISGVLGACSGNAGENNDTDTETGDNTNGRKLSGTITMSGSTSMEKLANAAAEAFMNHNEGVTVSAEFVGSSAGVEQVIAGTVDIGNASRNLKESEKSQGAVENIVALDGIAVILDKSNTVANLTKDQLISIYTGVTRKWSEVGGEDQPVVVVGRESGSGTRGAFEELLGIEDLCKYSNEINSTGGVMAKVATIPGAIGYVSLDIPDDTVNTVQLEGSAPTAENVKAGKYFLSRPFIMATVGDISTQSEIVQAFFDFLESVEGKALIQSVGLITVD